jgi:hypothetical protein
MSKKPNVSVFGSNELSSVSEVEKLVRTEMVDYTLNL